MHRAEDLLQRRLGLRVGLKLKKPFVQLIEQVKGVFDKPLLVVIHC